MPVLFQVKIWFQNRRVKCKKHTPPTAMPTTPTPNSSAAIVQSHSDLPLNSTHVTATTTTANKSKKSDVKKSLNKVSNNSDQRSFSTSTTTMTKDSQFNMTFE